MAFDTDNILGIGFIVAGGCTSLLCVGGILLYALFRGASGPDASDSTLFLNLMVASLFHAIGIIFSVKWATEGVVTEGPICTAQAVLKQIGNNGVSFTSLAITIQTWWVLVSDDAKQVDHNQYNRIIILLIWICTGLVVVVPNLRHDTYYGNTGFWCYINSNCTTERLTTDYVWVWLTGLVMVILYSYLAVMLYYHWGNNIYQAEHKAVARKLILYPIVYIICVLPNSVTRWLSFTHHHVPDKGISAANALHAFLGFFNLFVFCVTRPGMVFGGARPAGAAGPPPLAQNGPKPPAQGDPIPLQEL